MTDDVLFQPDFQGRKLGEATGWNPRKSVIFAMTSSENMVKSNTFYVAPADFGACSQASKPVQEMGRPANRRVHDLGPPRNAKRRWK